MFIFKFIGDEIWCDEEVGTICNDWGEGTMPLPPPLISAFDARSISGDDIDDESARLFDIYKSEYPKSLFFFFFFSLILFNFNLFLYL